MSESSFAFVIEATVPDTSFQTFVDVTGDFDKAVKIVKAKLTEEFNDFADEGDKMVIHQNEDKPNCFSFTLEDGLSIYFITKHQL